MQFSINKELQFPAFLEVKGEKYEVSVREFSKKNSSVIVKNDVVEVRLSNKLNFKQKQKHVDELLNSIRNKLVRKSPQKTKDFTYFLNLGYFYFGGVKFSIEKKQGRGVKLIGDIFYIGVLSEVENIEKKIRSLLIERFKNNIIERVRYINSISYNYNFRNISVKYVLSKWGHCTSRNDLMFNIKLANAPIDLMDYVIYHELAHIKVKNHSQAFWREVERFCPNYRELKKALNKNPPKMYNEFV